MHLYRLKILLTILFTVTWSPICFNLSSFYRHIFFSSLIPSFSLFTPRKRTQNWFTTIRHILDFSLYLLFKSIVICTSLRCVKSVQIRSFFCSVFSRIWIEYGKKYGPEKTPYLNFFHAELFTLTCLYSIYTYLSIDKIDLKYVKYRNYDEIF